jgi:hypothetical protein
MQSRREQSTVFFFYRPTWFLVLARRKDDRRLRPPEPVPPYEGLYYVQSYGNACPQQLLVLPNGLDFNLVNDINHVVTGMYDNLKPTDEDCECYVGTF